MIYAKNRIKCIANPKGSKAIKINDYRRVNARNVNASKFPNSSFYIFHIDNSDLWKLGVSQNIERRLRDINNSMPFTVSLIYSQKIENTYKFEELIHDQYKSKFIQNEWFKLTEDDVVEIMVDCKLSEQYILKNTNQFK